MTTLQEIPLTTITGESTSLADYAGQVLLVVNVASKCGLTPQYAGLEALHSSRADAGFQVLGFPANDFGAQEPGSNEEIAEFCKATYAIDFPMFSKISVVGDDQHPLYAALTAAVANASGGPDVQWNFEKFLIARDGSVAGRFAPTVNPDDPTLVDAIDAELAKPAG